MLIYTSKCIALLYTKVSFYDFNEHFKSQYLKAYFQYFFTVFTFQHSFFYEGKIDNKQFIKCHNTIVMIYNCNVSLSYS